MRTGGGLSIAYVHHGWQSGVTSAVARALLDRGHDVRLVTATGALEPRDPVTRRLRPRPDILLHLALAWARFGRRGLEHRWNTSYAFDRHGREAGAALGALRPAPDVVLQNGALFAPGAPPPFPYALLVDRTRALAEASPGWPRAGVPEPLRYGDAWFAREAAVYRGAAVLATFSVPEIVREGETGLLVPPGDPVALAGALERLLADLARARAMGARGRARVFAGGLWHHVAARLERALDDALATRGRAA